MGCIYPRITWTQISGGSRGGAQGARFPPVFLDPTVAQRAETIFFETTPTPPYLRVWMTAPPALSEGLDPPLLIVYI